MGTWIEINNRLVSSLSVNVVPLVGTWIEIEMSGTCSDCMYCRSPCGNVDWNSFPIPATYQFLVSFPLWERGLKYNKIILSAIGIKVVPLVGTWIEISKHAICVFPIHVVPLVGTWIEIVKILVEMTIRTRRSPCGNVDWNGSVYPHILNGLVVPLVGTWIEIIFFSFS